MPTEDIFRENLQPPTLEAPVRRPSHIVGPVVRSLPSPLRGEWALVVGGLVAFIGGVLAVPSLVPLPDVARGVLVALLEALGAIGIRQGVVPFYGQPAEEDVATLDDEDLDELADLEADEMDGE